MRDDQVTDPRDASFDAWASAAAEVSGTTLSPVAWRNAAARRDARTLHAEARTRRAAGGEHALFTHLEPAEAGHLSAAIHRVLLRLVERGAVLSFTHDLGPATVTRPAPYGGRIVSTATSYPVVAALLLKDWIVSSEVTEGSFEITHAGRAALLESRRTLRPDCPMPSEHDDGRLDPVTHTLPDLSIRSLKRPGLHLAASQSERNRQPGRARAFLALDRLRDLAEIAYPALGCTSSPAEDVTPTRLRSARAAVDRALASLSTESATLVWTATAHRRSLQQAGIAIGLSDRVASKAAGRRLAEAGRVIAPLIGIASRAPAPLTGSAMPVDGE